MTDRQNGEEEDNQRVLRMVLDNHPNSLKVHNCVQPTYVDEARLTLQLLIVLTPSL